MPDSTPPALAVAFSDGLLHARACQLAEHLDLPFAGLVGDVRQAAPVADVLLYLSLDGLALQLTGKGAPGPVRAEFVHGKAGYRREHGGGTGQLVAKAVGLQKTRRQLTLLDATAGLGQDAFVLAGLGCDVTLLERAPVVHALLQDGLQRAALVTELAPLLSRMTLLPPTDAISFLNAAEEPVADVIHLDPMFPHRDKSAQVKKEMRVFRDLVGEDLDAPALLAAALRCARYRVVVKRPRKAPVIEGVAPTMAIEGKSSRYDVYALHALPAV